MIQIKYLFLKSVQILIVNFLISIFIVICFSNFVEAYRTIVIPADQMPESYESFTISDDYPSNDLKKVIDLCSSTTDSFILQKESVPGFVGVYFQNYNFAPDIKRGRSFVETDFDGKNNYILLEEEYEEEIFYYNGKQYYNLFNTNFEVIGVFRKSKNNINVDSSVYYVLNSQELASTEMGIANSKGTYKIDAGNDTDRLIKKIARSCILERNNRVSEVSFGERIQKALFAQQSTLIALVLVVIMIILNSFNITSCWIENRKKEIFIKRVIGARNLKIYLMFIKDYWMLLTVSFLPSIGVVYIVSLCDIEIFTGFNFSILTILLSYVMLLIISALTILIMMVYYSKNTISNIARC